MIAPRLSVTDTKGTSYSITQLGEAWVIDVAGGKYFLTAGNDPTLQARRWLGKLPRNSIWAHTPAVLASQHSPLILDVDGTIVRAWPAQLPEEPRRTYEHPHWHHRVVALQEKRVWMFAARGHETSHHGEASSDQSVADVEQLARTWLHPNSGGSE